MLATDVTRPSLQKGCASLLQVFGTGYLGTWLSVLRKGLGHVGGSRDNVSIVLCGPWYFPQLGAVLGRSLSVFVLGCLRAAVVAST